VTVDADALAHFAGALPALGALLAGRPAVVTPHAVEAARLLGTDVASVNARRFEVAAEVARSVRATVVLKGVPTVISDGDVTEVPAGQRLVVSTDTAVENVHFRRAWLSPREIAYRAAMAALSDLAAMAAMPIGIVVALTLPPSWREHTMELADGLAEAAREA